MPRTHHFAQARTVFAVAKQRSREIYDPPGSVTLWNLPAELEDEFELSWQSWIDCADEWAPFFAGLDQCSDDLVAELAARDLVTPDQIERAESLRRSAEMRGVSIPGQFQASDDDVGMLALGFSRSEQGKLALPFQALGQTSRP